MQPERLNLQMIKSVEELPFLCRAVFFYSMSGKGSSWDVTTSSLQVNVNQPASS